MNGSHFRHSGESRNLVSFCNQMKGDSSFRWNDGPSAKLMTGAATHAKAP
jgi:hypothetical protein